MMKRLLVVSLVLALLVPRCMPKPVYAYSGTVSVWVQKDNDYTARNFAGTTVGLQAAIDYLAGGKGQVQIGPGTLSTSTAIWIHSYCRLIGAGRTIIKRASGSITDSDAANSGCVVGTSAYGSNGTLSSSAAIQYDITISDLTLDGNYSGQTTPTSATPHQAGLLAHSVDGGTILNVAIKNTWRSGYMIIASRRFRLNCVEADTVGQLTGILATTANAFDFYNFDFPTGTNLGTDFTLTNFLVRRCGSAAISVTTMKRVSISNGVVSSSGALLEIQNSASDTVADISMSNVVAEDMDAFLLSVSHAGTANTVFRNISVNNIEYDCHATAHDEGIILLGVGAPGCAISGVRISNVVARNINSADVTASAWVNLTSLNTNAINRDVILENCQFYGLPSSTRTNDIGININSTTPFNFIVRNVLLKDVAGFGVTIGVQSAGQNSHVFMDRAVIDGANNTGVRILNDATSSALLEDLVLRDCVAKDTNKQTGSEGLQIRTNNGTATVRRITLDNCVTYKTAGSTMLYGLDVTETSGTIDDVTIRGGDYSRVQTSSFNIGSGTPTNIHFTPRPGKGTDIASAATISIPTDGDVFHVTGTTNITNGITVNAWDNGRTVKLIFDSTPTVTDTGTSKLNGNFIATADDVLTLSCDGTNWYEVQRQTN